MSKCTVDPNVYSITRGKSILIIGTHVDDFACFSNDINLFNDVKAIISKDYDITESEMTSLLGVNVESNAEDGSCHIHMSKYIRGIGKSFGVQPRAASNPASAQMSEPEIWNYEPEVGSSEYLSLRTRALRYRSLVPSMLYATTCCRPETAFAISKLCQHLDNPSECHLKCADQTLSYMVETADLGITYYPDGTLRDANLTGYYSPLKEGLCGLSDSNWCTGRSTSGFLIQYGGGSVSWMSKRQPVTALSSTEAEYYAASSCGQEILFLRHFLRDIGYEETAPTRLKIDNSACVKLGEHFESAKRVRHIDRRVHFLTDYQEDGVLKVEPISTHLNTSDMMTKPLPKDKFVMFRRHALGMRSATVCATSRSPLRS